MCSREICRKKKKKDLKGTCITWLELFRVLVIEGDYHNVKYLEAERKHYLKMM